MTFWQAHRWQAGPKRPKQPKQSSPVILKNVSALKLAVWLTGALTVLIIVVALIGAANQGPSTTPAGSEPCAQIHTANYCAQAEGKPLPGVSVQHAAEAKGAEKAIRELEELHH